MHKRFHVIFAIWYSNGTDAIAVSHKYLFIAGKEKSFFPKLLSSFQISMEDKNRNVFVELRCIYHMHNEQRKSSMPIPKFCSKLSHTIPNAYTKIKTCLRICRTMYLDTTYCIQRVCSASNWCKSKFQSSNSLMSRADNRTQLLLNLSSNV